MTDDTSDSKPPLRQFGSHETFRGTNDSTRDALLGEVVADERHYPEYTKGCWGSPTHRLCWLCKLRLPLKILRLHRHIR